MSTKEDFIYDDNDFLIEQISYFTGFDEWLNYRRSEFINDVNGNILQKTTYKSTTGSDWIYDSREDREYNFIGLITKLIYINYVDSTDQWVNDQRLDYVYDTYENLVESITLHWDTISGEWLSISKTELNYNLDFMLDDVLLPASWPEFGVAYDIRPLYKNLLVEVNYFSKNDAAWKNEDREIYYYGERDVSAISENPFIDINIYPNPVDDVISITGIDLSKPTLIKFFDLHGKLLLIQNIDENNRIDVSYLDQGLYICKINQDGRTTNHKILIK
jgi:hypothetical protein